jgi:biopolymer transport protein ExbB/TolQ
VTPSTPTGQDSDLDLNSIAAEAAAADAAAASGVPLAKKRPSRRHSPMKAALPVVTAVLLTTLLQIVIKSVVPPEAYLYRLFRPPGGWIMSLVPGLIVFILVWTLVDLILKYADGRANESDLDRREIKQLPSLISSESVASIQRRILSTDSPDRPVARRLLWLLYYLEHNADAQRTHELLRHQADLDADTAAGGYRTVKLFIWAMPILGFVGTVLGISLAVGGFSNFLTSNMNIDDVSRVTAELGNVASGLSFAFDTTLLGLLAGLVANVFSSGVQKRDERFFTRLEELGLSLVANSRPAAAKGAPGLSVVPAVSDPHFEAVMQARLEEIGSIVDRTRQVMQGLSETSARMNAGLIESMTSVQVSVGELTETSRRMNTGLSESMMSVHTTVEGLARSLEGVSQALAADAASQESIEAAVHRLAGSIASFGEGLAELRAEQNTLAPVLTRLAGPLELRLVPGPTVDPGA